MTRPSWGSSDSTSASNDTRRAPSAETTSSREHSGDDQRRGAGKRMATTDYEGVHDETHDCGV